MFGGYQQPTNKRVCSVQPKTAATISTTMAECFHVHLAEVSRLPLCLEATIFKKKIAHPMIERPYAVSHFFLRSQ